MQFYALLLTALLELRLKQQCVARHEAAHAVHSAPPAIAGLMISPERLVGARGSTFLATIGEKLPRYWKISLHWLVTLRNYLVRPFTAHIALHLGRI